MSNKQELTFEEYKRIVIDTAYNKYGKGPVCTDSIKDSYNSGEPIEGAVEQVITDSIFWDYGKGK